MKIKFLVLAVFSALAAPAMAVNSVIDLSSGSAAGAQTHVGVMGSSFVDRYFFSLSQPVVGGLGASDVQLSYMVGPATVSFDIGGLTASLWSDLGTVGSFDTGVDSIVSAFGTGEQVSGSFQLAAGNYFFQIGGNTMGTTGGVYSWAASVSPVPEPEQYSMLLAGLGLLGLIARRRVGR